jgi:hypothetical protein
MSISRDEAREVAVLALLVAVGLRVGAGTLQAVDELIGPTNTQSVLTRFFAQIGSTVGILTLGAALLVALSPRGSITRGVNDLCRRVAGAVAAAGLLGAFHTLAFGYSPTLGKIWFSMINGLAAATLAGTGWWILRNLDEDR